MQSRLVDKFKRAGGIVARQHAKIEQRLDKVIEREQDIERKTNQAFGAHEAMLDATEKHLDGFEHQLAQLTNDPFQHGDSTEEVILSNEVGNVENVVEERAVDRQGRGR